MRRPFVGGNWKMNTNAASGPALVQAFAVGIAPFADRVDVAVFPPFVYLREIGDLVRRARAPVLLGAQSVYPEALGAFTGEISIPMLTDCGVQVVLAGHSERRHVIGESDQMVNRKVRAILDADLRCVLCVGETLEQRERGETDRVNSSQVRAGLSGVKPDQMPRLTIAYEPVWAIGTGKNATPADAQDAHRKIREVVAQLFNRPIADTVRIQYGGSVKASNAADLFAQPDVDGGLIGGASLNAQEFLAIVRAAANARA